MVICPLLYAVRPCARVCMRVKERSSTPCGRYGCCTECSPCRAEQGQTKARRNNAGHMYDNSRKAVVPGLSLRQVCDASAQLCAATSLLAPRHNRQFSI